MIKLKHGCLATISVALVVLAVGLPSYLDSRGSADAESCTARPVVAEHVDDDVPLALTGCVLTIDGLPIAGATVAAADHVSPQTARTSADGSFVLPRHPAGLTELRVTADGFATLDIPRAQIVEPAVFALGRSHRVHGVVRAEATGRGVTAQVFVEPKDSAPHTVRTNASGAFTFTASEWGASLRARARRYFDGVAAVAPVTSGETVDVELQGPAVRTLVVVDAEGDPVPGVLCRVESAFMQPGDVVGRGSPDGRIDIYPPGKQIWLSAPGHGTTKIERLWRNANATVPPRVVALQREQRITGLVRSSHGDPIAGARVMAFANQCRAEVTTDETGAFTFEGLPATPGMLLWTFHDDWSPARQQVKDVEHVVVELADFEEAFFEFDPKPPPHEGPIVLRLDATHQLTRTYVVDPATLDERNSIQFRLPQGDWGVHAWTVNLGNKCQGLAVRSRSENRLRIPLEPRTVVSGCVTDSAGRPIAGARVTARGEGAIDPHAPVAFTDTQGRFRVAACHNLYRISALHPEHGNAAVKTEDGKHFHLVLRRR